MKPTRGVLGPPPPIEAQEFEIGDVVKVISEGAWWRQKGRIEYVDETKLCSHPAWCLEFTYPYGVRLEDGLRFFGGRELILKRSGRTGARSRGETR
jgi:hypothetical protein